MLGNRLEDLGFVAHLSQQLTYQMCWLCLIDLLLNDRINSLRGVLDDLRLLHLH